MENGDISEVENCLGTKMCPTCYDFTTYELANFFGNHAFSIVLISRILQSANTFLGTTDETIEQLARVYSCRIWSTYPWMKKRKPFELGGVLHLCLSFEAGDFAERTMVMVSLKCIQAYTSTARWDGSAIMANAMAYTGRLPFIKTQDCTVELKGVGCRS
jgi:hypothetical protein